MNKNKKVGKGTGVPALALALAFCLASCGGDDGGGGGGTSLGPSALGKTFTITGHQIYTDADYEGSDSLAEGDGTVDSNLGVGTITDGKLTFTAIESPPDAELKPVSELSGLLTDGGDYLYDNIDGTFLTSTAKYASIQYLSTDTDTGIGSIERGKETELQNDSSVYSVIKERATYIYVNEAVTITAKGKENKVDTSSGGTKYTNTYTSIGVDLNLAKGWNVVYEKVTSSYNYDSKETTETRELKAGDPAGVYWTNDAWF